MTTDIEQEPKEILIHLRTPHPKQQEIRDSLAKRKVVRAGRRGGKTVIGATVCCDKFLLGMRPLYATPTTEQLETWWYEVKKALAEPLEAGIYRKNETEHTIELPGTKTRMRGKTAWNADMLRGDYTDYLVLDEYQLMNEDTWLVVGMPMLLDNNGDAMFIYTPPSLHSRSITKAKDPRHASKMFKAAREDTTGLWQAFHFSSHDNPHISKEALSIIARDMSQVAYRLEIMAEDDELQVTELVYGKFNETVCKIPRFEIPAEWSVLSGHDFGGANPAALFIARVKLPIPQGASPYIRYGDFVAFREYLPGPGSSTAQHVEKFKLIVKGLEMERSAGGSHQEDEIRQGYAAHGWPILEPTIHNIKPQVDKVTGLMELNKFFVFDDLLYYLEEIMNCLWKRDATGLLTDVIQDEAHYHLCAAARYILSEFTPETVGGREPQTSTDER